MPPRLHLQILPPQPRRVEARLSLRRLARIMNAKIVKSGKLLAATIRVARAS